MQKTQMTLKPDIDTPYVKLRRLREHIALLPGLKTYKDFDIAIEIGHHELIGNPLNQKQLLLLDIAAPATVRRHLNRLISVGLVNKQVDASDHRYAYFVLTERAHVLFDNCINQLSSLLGFPENA